MSSDRFHKAAKDGLIDVLKEATRRDVNTKDVDGMTPTLWAAFEGRLDALRLLVGRGGDPDKSDQFGNTALHLAAAKGHMQCVDFLIKFGCNIFNLDIDQHSAKDLAAINNRDDILRYLDAAAANIEISDKKRAKALKEQAKKNSEKRAREYASRQQRLEQEAGLETSAMPHRPSNVLQLWKQKIMSTSQPNGPRPTGRDQQQLQNVTKFSALVGGTINGSRGGAVQKKVNAVKLKNQMDNGDFKIGEVEAGGRRSVRSLQGLRRDSEILYVATYDTAAENAGKRGKITDVFDVERISDEEYGNESAEDKYSTLSRSLSQPDFLAASAKDDIAEEVMLHRPSGLFDRPMLGTLAFPRRSLNALSQFVNDQSSLDSSSSPAGKPAAKTKKVMRAKPRSLVVISDSDDSADDSLSENDDQDEDGLTPLAGFLAAWSLDEYLPLFLKQEIRDLDTLMILTETDLKSLELPLGPFRKLCVAIQNRKNALTNPGPITDSRL